MRKSLSILLLFFSVLNYSQEKFGVFGGVNYSAFSNGFLKNLYAEDKLGIQIGILYEVPITEKITFRPKIVFSQQGDRTLTKSNNLTSLSLNQIDYKLNYLNFPLDFKFWNKIYVITGPQIGFIVSKQYSDVYIGEPNGTDFGLNLGTGFTINKLFFEFGFYQGLSNINTYNSNVSSSTINVRNTLAKFTLGYKL